MDNTVKTSWRQQCRPTTRRLIQLYSALLHNAHLKGFIDGEIYQGAAKYACVPGFNCYSCPGAVGACPLGALQNALAATGHRAGWYMMGILLLFGTILGRTICGWLCPVGLLQELLHKVPTFKIKKSNFTRLLSYLKYVFLAIFVIEIPLWYGLKHDMPMPGFCKYICPAGTLEGALALLSNPGNDDLYGMLGILFTRKFVILIIIGFACIFCYRSFCRFICPLGAIYGLFNRFCLVGVQVDTVKCNGCGNCVRHCGMDVKHVGDHECINCAKCMDVCSRKAISFKAGKMTLRAPAGTFSEEEQKTRKNTGRIAWGIALAVLCFALVWFNFLDPAVQRAGQPEADLPAPQNAEGGTAVGFEVGQQLEDFTIDCFDGSTFTLSETRGKVTFINLWATYCTPCVQELPAFDAFWRAHKEDAAVLAVHSSVVTDDPEAYLADKGYGISFALDTDDKIWRIVNGSSTLPQTIVLDRNGVVIYNQKGSISPEALEALYEQASAGSACSADDGAGLITPVIDDAAGMDAYLILVIDEKGAPVQDVTVQFCSDKECMLGKTDASGITRFDSEAGSYTVHILKPPAGYAADDTEYIAPSTPGTVTIVLRAEVPEKTPEGEEDATRVIDSPKLGLHYERPEKYADLKGFLDINANVPDDGFSIITVTYYAVPPDRMTEYAEYCNAYIDAFFSDTALPVPPEPSWMSQREYALLYSFFGISDGRGEEELLPLLREHNPPFYDELLWLEEVWTDGDNTFYAGQYERVESQTDEYREHMGDYFPEFEELLHDKETFLSAFSFRAPLWPSDMKTGSVIRFETTDLDGNPVSSKELFARSKVTMINLWGTWCTPCKRELPELAVMARDFEAKGCQMIGICNDAYQAGKPEIAKELLQAAGAEYLNLAGSPDLDELLHANGFPTSYFVDSEGRLLLPQILGADLEAYPQALEEALSLVE